MANKNISATAFPLPVSCLRWPCALAISPTTPLAILLRPRIVNPNMIGASTNPTAFPNVYFQCDGAGNPLPANPDGSQAQGTPCNKIPSGLINNIGQAMINLYPAPNANNASAGYNYVNEPVRVLDETKFDTRLDHTLSEKDNAFGRFSYDQAFSYVPGGSPGFAEANAFGSNQRIINHARNVALGETHVFSATMVNQATFGYNRIFDYISSQGTGTCASATIVPAAFPTPTSDAPPAALPSRLLQLRTCFDRVPGRLLGPRRSRLLSVPGWNQHLLFQRLARLIHNKHDLRLGIDFRAQSNERGH